MSNSALFIKFLVCPETHNQLCWADSNLIANLNAKIQHNQVKNRGGDAIIQPLEQGLLCEAQNYLYPVESGIPVLLKERAIALNDISFLSID
ncbi:Trm112 family protein [Kamptonema cortianum]|uniref:Trm112 family protein n=1 Tax=Geitlerinema calcuttense TaxID=1471433 RepID=UPI0025401690|nr:Trm112 family protein [Kamptonema cortianum]